MLSTSVSPNPVETLSAAVRLSVQLVTMTIIDAQLRILLLSSAADGDSGWRLPEDLLLADQTLDDCIDGVLHDQVGLHGAYLEQLCTFDPVKQASLTSDITVGYFAISASAEGAGTPARRWFSVDELPGLSIECEKIITLAVERLQTKLSYSTIAFSFLAPEFTLSELQTVYEIIRGGPLDKRNFRKHILSLPCIRDTGKTRRAGCHRPARLYAYCSPGKIHYLK